MTNDIVNQIKVGSTTYDIKPYLGSATSGDSTTANEWTAVDEAITTSDSYDTVFNKVTKMVKNVRYLYSKLGTTDFSGISNTVSGAIVNLNNGKSDTTHNHDGVYSAIDHTHSIYSLTTHTHSQYSTTGHTHSEYAASNHNHDSLYATINHTHSEYSTTGHTHSNYSTTGHTHSNYSTTGHTHSDYISTSDIVTTQTNSNTKVPSASLVYSMSSAAVPSGAIVIWSGSVDTIPSGYVLCNGQNGTPDLRDRFVIGAGSSYAVGSTGGSTSHSHGINCVQKLSTSGSGGGPWAGDLRGSNTYSTTALPPYYALCYIMKT